MKRKKFCLVIPSLIGGGMERIMSEFANYLAQNDAEVWLVLMFRDDMFYKIDSRVKIIQPTHKKKYNLTYAFYLFPFLRRQIKKIDPDVVLSFGERYNSYLLLALFGTQTPVYISDRSSPHKHLNRINLLMSRVLYRRAAGIIAQTSKAAELLYERLNDENANIRVIPNPLREIIEKRGRKKNQIVALGRLVKEKRYDRLLDIIMKLENKSWNLLIVGDGRLRPEIEKIIDDYSLKDRVFLAGQQKDVDPFLDESSIFVLTSDIEGYPNALCEAMAHGLASVSFDCVAGPRDIIDNGVNGILVEDGDIEHFAKELDELIMDTDKRQRIGNEAEKIKNKLNRNEIFRQYLDFIIPDDIQKQNELTG